MWKTWEWQECDRIKSGIGYEKKKNLIILNKNKFKMEFTWLFHKKVAALTHLPDETMLSSYKVQ